MMPYNFHKENPWPFFSGPNTRQRSQESQKSKSRNFKGYGIEECMNEMKKKCKSKKGERGKKRRGGRGHGCHSVSSSKPWPPNKQFQKRMISILVASTIQNRTSTVYYENAVARGALCRSRATNFPHSTNFLSIMLKCTGCSSCPRKSSFILLDCHENFFLS